MIKGYVTFHSVLDSLKFEKSVKNTSLDIQLVPVPREISSSCGVAALFTQDMEQPVRDFIQVHELKISGIHMIEQADRKRSLMESFK